MITLRRISRAVLVILALQWSGLGPVVAAETEALEALQAFKQQREIVYTSESAAAAAQAEQFNSCKSFEAKLGAFIDGLRKFDVITLFPEASPAGAGAAATSLIITPETPSQAETPSFYDQYFGEWNAGSSSNNAASDNPQVDVKFSTGPTAAAIGFPKEVAAKIDGTPELQKLFSDAYYAGQTCAPALQKFKETDAKQRAEFKSWAKLAVKAGPKPLLESQLVWAATQVRRGTQMGMHTTVPKLGSAPQCAGDLFQDLAFFKMAKALANDEPSYIAFMADYLKALTCLDVRQTLALDRGITWASAATLMVHANATNAAPRKRMLEFLYLLAVPIVDINKVMGPTPGWLLVESAKTGGLMSANEWILDPDSLVVKRGITAFDRITGTAKTYPICSAPAPAEPLEKPNYLDPTGGITMADTPQYGTKDSAEMQNQAAEVPGAYGSAQTQDINPPVDFSGTSGTASADEGEDVLQTPFGKSLKEIKPVICPAEPLPVPPFGGAVGPAEKTVAGFGATSSGSGCYPLAIVTDSFSEDHVGFGVCGLTDMVPTRVCKAIVCDQIKAAAQFEVPEQAAGEYAAPAPQLPKACGLPIGVENLTICSLLPEKSTFKDLMVPSVDDNCKFNPVAEQPAEFIEFEPMYITGRAPNEAEVQSATSRSDNSEPSSPSGRGDQTSTTTTPRDTSPPTQVSGGRLAPPPPPPPVKPSAEVEKFAVELGKLAKQFGDSEGSPPIGSLPKIPEILTEADLKEAITVFAILQKLVKKAQELYFTALQSNKTDIGPLTNTAKWFMQVDTLLMMLRTDIMRSPAFKAYREKVTKAARSVLENKKYRAAVKLAREKMLGVTIPDDVFDLAYQLMLLQLERVIFNVHSEPENALAWAESNLTVSVFLQKNMDLDGNIGSVLHEFALHILSYILGQFGYAPNPYEDEKPLNSPATYDHSLGNAVAGLTQQSLGYWTPGSSTGYKSYLPGGTPPDPTQPAASAPASSPPPNSTPSSSSPASLSPLADVLLGAAIGSGGVIIVGSLVGLGIISAPVGLAAMVLLGIGGVVGAWAAGSQSGGDSPDASPAKQCDPLSPNCAMGPCLPMGVQAQISCVAQGGGWKVKTFGNGPISYPAPLDDVTGKLSPQLQAYVDCLGGSGAAAAECPEMECAPGLVAKKVNGICQCSTESGGNGWEGYMGPPDACAAVYCAPDSTNPCCQKSGEPAPTPGPAPSPYNALPDTPVPSTPTPYVPETPSYVPEVPYDFSDSPSWWNW